MLDEFRIQRNVEIGNAERMIRAALATIHSLEMELKFHESATVRDEIAASKGYLAKWRKIRASI